MFPFSPHPRLVELRNPLGGRELAAVASMSELEHAFLLERTRHRRTGAQVSLVAFLPLGERSPSFPDFVEVVRSCVRSIDVIGWLDCERIAILLPETNKRSGWVLAREVLTSLAPTGMSFHCEVFTYPTDWPGYEGSPVVDMPLSPAV